MSWAVRVKQLGPIERGYWPNGGVLAARRTRGRCWGVAFLSRLGKLCFDGMEESRGVSRTRPSTVYSGSTVDLWRRSAAASGGGGSDALGVSAGLERK
jgi:hypothetical protein